MEAWGRRGKRMTRGIAGRRRWAVPTIGFVALLGLSLLLAVEAEATIAAQAAFEAH